MHLSLKLKTNQEIMVIVSGINKCHEKFNSSSNLLMGKDAEIENSVFTLT